MARYRIKTGGTTGFSSSTGNPYARRAVVSQSIINRPNPRGDTSLSSHTLKVNTPQVGRPIKFRSSVLKTSTGGIGKGLKTARKVTKTALKAVEKTAKVADKAGKVVSKANGDGSVEQRSASLMKDAAKDGAKDTAKTAKKVADKANEYAKKAVKKQLKKHRQKVVELKKKRTLERLKLKNGSYKLKLTNGKGASAKKTLKSGGRKLKSVNRNTRKVVKGAKKAEKVTREAARKSAKAAVKSAKMTAKATKTTIKVSAKIVKWAIKVTEKVIEVTVKILKAIISFIAATAEVSIPVIAIILVICLIVIAVGRIIVLFNPDNSTLQGVATQCMTKYNMWTDAVPALACDLSDGTLDGNFENFAADCFDGDGNFDTDGVIDQVIDNTGWVDWQMVLAIYAVEIGSEEGIETNQMTDESARVLKRVFTDMYLGTDVDWDEPDDGVFPDLTVTNRLEYQLGFELGDEDEGFEWSWNPVELLANAVDAATTVQLYINATPATVEDMADEYEWGDAEWAKYNEFMSLPNPLWNVIMESYPLGTNDPASWALSQLGKGFSDLWDGEPYDWCAKFVTTACQQTGLYGENNYYYGNATGLIDHHTGETWVDAWFFVAQSRGTFERNTGRSGYLPQRGDLIVFNRSSSTPFVYDFDTNTFQSGSLSHIAIILSYTEHADGSITITYIGGNQSYEGSSGAANNRVTETTVDLEALNNSGTYKVFGFIRPYLGG